MVAATLQNKALSERLLEKYFVEEIAIIFWKLGITEALEAQELLRRRELAPIRSLLTNCRSLMNNTCPGGSSRSVGTKPPELASLFGHPDVRFDESEQLVL